MYSFQVLLLFDVFHYKISLKMKLQKFMSHLQNILRLCISMSSDIFNGIPAEHAKHFVVYISSTHWAYLAKWWNDAISIVYQTNWYWLQLRTMTFTFKWFITFLIQLKMEFFIEWSIGKSICWIFFLFNQIINIWNIKFSLKQITVVSLSIEKNRVSKCRGKYGFSWHSTCHIDNI